MKAITEDNIQELYNSIAPILRNWVMVESKIRSFENNANLATFMFIFKDDAERLMLLFRQRCNSKYLEFKDCLTNDDMYYL